MKNSLRLLSTASIALPLLSACGAGGSGQGQAVAAVSDGAAYAATQAYCGSNEPSGNAAQADSFEVTWPTHAGPTYYDVNALVSPAGYSNPTGPAQRLEVDSHDYRGVGETVVTAGYSEPAWKMGISFEPLLAPKSAACVASLGKLTPVPAMPGSFNAGGAYTLSWSSKWSARIPAGPIAGTRIDGFELVSNFTFTNATAFFVMSKTRLASPSSASICYLAPSASQWDCAAASVSDLGKDWGMYRSASQAGVYVLTE